MDSARERLCHVLFLAQSVTLFPRVVSAGALQPLRWCDLILSIPVQLAPGQGMSCGKCLPSPTHWSMQQIGWNEWDTRNACAGTVLKLGTQQHHDALLDAIDSLDATGCFALTELGFGEPAPAALSAPPTPHSRRSALEQSLRLEALVGCCSLVTKCFSTDRCMQTGPAGVWLFGMHPIQATAPRAGNNAVEMQTTATYDQAADEFVIDTPTTLAQKYWITNSAVHAKWAVVFAQLLLGGRNEGIHGFLVRIRHEVRMRWTPCCYDFLLVWTSCSRAFSLRVGCVFGTWRWIQCSAQIGEQI